MHCHRATTSRNRAGSMRDPPDANATPKDAGVRLLVVEVAVSGQDVALELFLVGVPELSGLGVQRARAGLLSVCERT